MDINTYLGRGAEYVDGIIMLEGKNVQYGYQTLIGCRPKYPKNTSSKKKSMPSTIEIGDNSYIGHKCIIYAGAKIGKNCYIADGTMIRESVKIGDGVTIGRGCVIEQDVKIGNKVRIREQVYLAPKTIIEDGCFLAAKVSTYNDNTIGRRIKNKKYNAPLLKKGCRIGGGAIILPGITIGIKSIVGAGSVVTKEVTDGIVCVGNPAECLRTVKEQNVLDKNRNKVI